MAKNEAVAAGPATRDQLAEVAIQASIVANSTSMAIDFIRSFLTGQAVDKLGLADNVDKCLTDLDEASSALESLFDDLTGWTEDNHSADAA